jgi:hypothetical protein
VFAFAYIEFNCEVSWLVHRNTRLRLSYGGGTQVKIVSTVGECLDACLMSSSGSCAAVVVSPEAPRSTSPDSHLRCRKHGVSMDTNMFVHSSVSDLYIMQSQCYRTGRPCHVTRRSKFRTSLAALEFLDMQAKTHLELLSCHIIRAMYTSIGHPQLKVRPVP